MENRFSRFGWWFLFLVGAIAFLIAKWSALYFPFFWDELGVYGPGVLYMVDHGPGLLPSSLIPELSRGHPLFFYFMFALWVKIFGYSLFKIHLLALLITIGVATCIFAIGKKYLSPMAALAGAWFFLAQHCVFAMGSMVLPEMLLALLMLGGLWMAFEEKWGWYFLWASLAVLTKESGLVLPAVVAGYFFLSLDWKKVGLSLIPLLAFGAFLIIQRIQNGWFFFELHTDSISLAWEDISFKIGKALNWLFVYQNRWVLAGSTGLGAVFGVLQWFQKKKRSTASLPVLMILFVLGIFAFTIINFYMDRYLMGALAVLCILLSMALSHLGKWHPSLIGIAGLGLILFSALDIHKPEDHGQWKEADFRYEQELTYEWILESQKKRQNFWKWNYSRGKLFLLTSLSTLAFRIAVTVSSRRIVIFSQPQIIMET